MIRKRYFGTNIEKEWRDEILDSLSPEQSNILVLDDQISVARSSTSIADLFTKGLHHKNLTVIYQVPNVYNQSIGQNAISLNSHYSVV